MTVAYLFVRTLPTKMVYYQHSGESVDINGLELYAINEDHKDICYPVLPINIKIERDIDITQAGIQSVILSAHNCKVSFEVCILESSSDPKKGGKK